jgi:ribonuclease P protein component
MSDETHISTKQPCARTASRVSSPDVNGGGTNGDSQSSSAWSQKTIRLISIGKRRDFLAANMACRVATPGFVLLVNPRKDGKNIKRLGITVTKKIGNAVVRNRMKRRFRALARDIIIPFGIEGADHVLIGRAGGIERDFMKLCDELDKAIFRASQKTGVQAAQEAS